MCRDEPQTRTHGLGSRFWSQVKPVFPPPNHYLFRRPIPYRSLWSYPWDRPLVNSGENQSLATATIPQRFGHCTCSELKYVECTEYVHVQAWTRACEQSVYVVCVQVGLLIGLLLLWWSFTVMVVLLLWWCVNVMVMCYYYGDVLLLCWCVIFMGMSYCYSDVFTDMAMCYC